MADSIEKIADELDLMAESVQAMSPATKERKLRNIATRLRALSPQQEPGAGELVAEMVRSDTQYGGTEVRVCWFGDVPAAGTKLYTATSTATIAATASETFKSDGLSFRSDAEDAARYRWLRSSSYFPRELLPEKRLTPCPDNKPGCLVAHFAPYSADDLDAAIDAARRARGDSV